MQIEPRTFTLPSGEVLMVRSLCAEDAEAQNAFRCATYSETYFMARYPEEGANLEAMRNRLADCGESPVNFEVGVFDGEEQDRKSTRLNSSHRLESRMPSSA